MPTFFLQWFSDNDLVPRGQLELNRKCSQLVWLQGSWLQHSNKKNADILWEGRKRGRSECGISWGSLCGRSALVYSVQLNKLKCQGHNASSTSWIGGKKKNIVACRGGEQPHYSCGCFNTCRNTQRPPERPPSLRKRNKINTPLGKNLTKEKSFHCFIFQQVSWWWYGRNGWKCKRGLLVSHKADA